MRISPSQVRFERPFELGGLTFPAGEYLVETDEEVLDVLTRIAYRRASVSLHVPSGAGFADAQVVTVAPAEFDAALRREAEARIHDESRPDELESR